MLNRLEETRHLSTFFINTAKTLWGLAVLIKIAAAILGILIIIFKFSTSSLSFIALASALISEFLQWRFDTIKGKGESIKRKLEFADGLGWPISEIELSDHFANVSTSTRKKIEKQVEDNYFASNLQPGPKRLLQNLQESAWWSKNLSSKMINYFGILSAVLIISSLITFMIGVSTTKNVNQLIIINKVIVSVLSLILSIGIVKILIGYIKFNKSAEKAEKASNDLILSNKLNEIDALRALHEYQIARSSAPFIPSFLWRIHRDNLNELWKKYRKN